MVARFGPGKDAQLLVLGDYVEVLPDVAIRSALTNQLKGATSGFEAYTMGGAFVRRPDTIILPEVVTPN